MLNMTVPSVLADLLRIKRPHGGVGEERARKRVLREIKSMGMWDNARQDAHGNIEVKVGPDVGNVFTAHLDTVHREDGPLELLFIQETGELVADETVDGKTKAAVLGADDAAGVFLLTELMRAGISGTYLFFVGEECGGVGSSAYVRDNPKFSANFVVSFDRRGYSDVITEQGCYQTASETFAAALAKQLNTHGQSLEYKPCDTGVYTDSKEFAGIVPECTNISVGYFNEHTVRECLDLDHLLRLRDALVRVQWDKLPICRTPVHDMPWGSYFNKAYGAPSKAKVLGAMQELKALAIAENLSYGEVLDFIDLLEEYL